MVRSADETLFILFKISATSAWTAWESLLEPLQYNFIRVFKMVLRHRGILLGRGGVLGGGNLTSTDFDHSNFFQS